MVKARALLNQTTIEVFVSDEMVVASLQDAAQVIVDLLSNQAGNTTHKEEDLADLEALNHVIKYYGGEPILFKKLREDDIMSERDRVFNEGVAYGMERGAYEEMTKEDVLVKSVCKCGCKE